MLGDFVYSNPTKLYFGQNAIEGLTKELPKYGKNILLVYGSGSIKKNGIYQSVLDILHSLGKNVVEDAGVMPNPTVEKLQEGIKRAKAGNIDFILAVGGGSVCDYAKALSVSMHCKQDAWEKYFIKFEDVDCEIVPLGCVLTMVGTGSEMNGGSVITNNQQKLKVGHVFGDNVFPKFSILNPMYTLSVPKYQMVAGIFDIMSHILEQYFSGVDDNTSDYIMEGLLRSLIHSANIAKENPLDYEARSNIMWIATWALNTLVAKGKSTDWEVHMIGQGVGAHTDATHGMTLSAVSMSYYKHIMPYGVHKFARYAVNVWGVDSRDKTPKQVALEGLQKMELWMTNLGLVMTLSQLGVRQDMLNDIAKSIFIFDSGYKKLEPDELLEILNNSL